MATHSDVCIIGAGACGLVLGTALAESGMSVRLLEAGHMTGHNRHLVSPAIKSKTPHRGTTEGWTTGLGGTTQLWGGQLWPWDPHEFEPRPWLAAKGWPISYGEFHPYYRRLLVLLGAGKGHARVHFDRDETLRGDSYYLKRSTWLRWGSRNLGHTLLRRLRAYPHIDILTGAVVTSVVQQSEDKVGINIYQGQAGTQRFTARKVVLAAGTIGNVRLLLTDPYTPKPTWLGHGFMDHLSSRVASFEVVDWGKFKRLFAPRILHGILTSPRLVANPDFLARNRLLSCLAQWEIELPQTSALRAARDTLRACQRGGPSRIDLPPARTIGRGSKEILATGLSALVLRRRYIPEDSNIYLRVDVEQPPRFQHALTLNQSNDALGRPGLQLTWACGALEKRSVEAFRDALIRDIPARDWGLRLTALLDPLDFSDTFHMMGGTRMGPQQDDHVVDEHLRLYSYPNVYVLGASAFPSGGVANPTMTAMALAVRLADTLTADEEL